MNKVNLMNLPTVSHHVMQLTALKQEGEWTIVNCHFRDQDSLEKLNI